MRRSLLESVMRNYDLHHPDIPITDKPTMTPAQQILAHIAKAREAEKNVTPAPWAHRKHPQLGGFVEAKIEGKPYGQEILGDDYFEDLSRESDCDFIAAARTDLPKCWEALEVATHALANLEVIEKTQNKGRTMPTQHASWALSKVNSILARP